MANIQSQKLSMINLGCGARFHPSWVNVDLHSSNKQVMAHDLRKNLPFADNTFDVVYHSHVLEHFPRAGGISFLNDCFRVCKPGGIIRVVVPDLENMARSYIDILERLLSADSEAENKYEWMMLELFDQTVRTKPGGDMVFYIQNASSEIRDYIAERVGNQLVEELLNPLKGGKPFSRFKRITINKLVNKFRRLTCLVINYILYGKRGISITNEFFFRVSGEIHRWMYDRYSLAKILTCAGFRSPKIFTAFESNIVGWDTYYLDINPDRSIYMHNSLYCEAFK